MNKILSTLALAAVLATASTAAMAQARPAVAEVGAYAGGWEDNDTVLGARVQFDDIRTPYNLAVEVTYDGLVGDNRVDRDLIGVNLVGEHALDRGFGVYALAGVGYQWSTVGDNATWTYGAGLTYAVSQRTELDLRVRTINSFENGSDDTAVTLGVNYAF